MPVRVFAQEFELALLRVLVQLPAVMRGLAGAGPTLAAQMREKILLDAAPAVGRGADVEDRLAAPEDVDATPLVRGILDGRRRERPPRAAHGHSGARRCNRRAAASTLESARRRAAASENLPVDVTPTATPRAIGRHSARLNRPPNSRAPRPRAGQAWSPSVCAE